MSISLNVLKHGRIKNAVTNWTSTNLSKQLRIGRISREL